ncbi:ABC transporter permease [Paenibacillus mendelii]|uniref:ABC transporter permease n=1 Tax=Paenibacillus mendelii TaxID=206163 RepID=A0ABV6J5P9_9BACL|nr:ABC transporter permease [Paenibacillus mendelii]MCQ6560080.1 ABC transporter permease [Paenibacillus mendelii]
MRSYGAMAGRYLKQQRKKSVLTIIGIILSVALISSLGTMGQALKDNMILNTKYEEGSFYFGYSKPSPELYKTLQKHILIDQLGVYRAGNEIPLTDEYSVKLSTADEEGFKLLPIHLYEGRLPAADHELAVEQWLLDKLPGTPGLHGSTQIEGPDGKTRNYEIVGVLNNQKRSQSKGSSEAFTYAPSANTAIDSQAMVLLTLKPEVDINQQVEDFKKLNDSLFTNHQLLALMGESADGNLNLTLAIIFGTLIGLVVLSTVAVIYNAFHIAVIERIRQFGLLRTLGASPGQIRSLVLREATMLSAIGVPLGLLIGWFGMWLVLWLMTQSGMKIMMMETFELTFHWWIMGGSFVIGFAAVYIAAWLPARKASSVSPVEAVKGAGSIVRESYRRVRIPSLLGLMGIEGQMASNNIRRNRTKFLITTFSIVISITLFISFHYFTSQALTITTTTNEDDRIAFQLNTNLLVDDTGKPNVVSDEAMKVIGGLPGIHGVYGIYQSFDFQIVVPEPVLKSDFVEKTNMALERVDTNLILYSDLFLYDEARLKEASKYLQSGTVDPKLLADQDGVILVQTVKPLTTDGKKEIMPITRYKVGDKLTIMTEYSSEPAKQQIREVTVAGILTQSPFGAPYQENTLVMIAAKPTIAKLMEARTGSADDASAMTGRTGLEVAMKDGADPEPVKQRLEELSRTIPGSRLVDIAEEQKETRNFNLQMKIFVYGFLIIIGVIGSLNIINTVQTNLLLRRKEIGLLQAVGMTMGQIRRMASLEGMWFGVIGSFWGILLGVGFSYFLYLQLSSVQGFPFEFPWGAPLAACGASLLVGMISVQGPLSRMEKANLLEELREEA